MKEILIPLNFTTTPTVYDTKQSFSTSDEASGVLTFTTTADVAGTVVSLTIRNASENANRQTVLIERLDVNRSPFSYALKNPLPFGQYEGTVLLKKNLTVIASATFLFGMNSSLSAEVLPDLVKAYSLDELVENVETEVSNLKDAYNLTVSETVKSVNKTESSLQAQENVRYLNEHQRKANELERIANENARIAAELARKDTFDTLVDSEVIEQTVVQEVAEKYQEIEALNAPEMVSFRQQLAETNLIADTAAQKADAMASGSPKGVYATLALLQAAYPTGTTGAYLVTADGKWYYWSGSAWTIGGTYQATGIEAFGVTNDKISRKTIDVEQIAFLSRGKNLYSGLLNTLNYQVNYSNGTLMPNKNYDSAPFIPIEPNTQYVQSPQLAHIAFYDANKTFISGLTYPTNSTCVSPPNAYYCRIDVHHTWSNNQFEIGSVATPYVPYVEYVTKYDTFLNKKWVSFGDSITGNGNWQPHVASRYGLIHVNKGIGGTFVSYINSNSMCDDVRITALDSDADIITFNGGINDWRNNVPLGTMNDTINTTFYGAVKMIAEKLIAKYPTKRIIFMTTTYALTANRGAWTDQTGYVNNLGLTSGDYGQVIKDVARVYGIPCIDLYGNCGWNKFNIASYLGLEADSSYLHPNADGAKRIASVVISKLKEIEPIV